jgi:hypothetical protein
MISKIIVVLFFLCMIHGFAWNLREQFTIRFYDQCLHPDKYLPFVNEFIEQQSHAHKKFLLFLYNDESLDLGGFGDRVSGAITAFINAVVTKRSFFMSSTNNGFDELFRPFNPIEIPDPRNSPASIPIQQPKLWSNWREWSGFDDWHANHLDFAEKRSEYEYNMTNCFNLGGDFDEVVHRNCSVLDNGLDEVYPIVNFASNRALICYYLLPMDPSKPRIGRNTSEELQRLFGLDRNQTSHGPRLYELTGCILRLLLWPTERLWKLIDQHYEEMIRFKETYQEDESLLSKLGDEFYQTLETSSDSLIHRSNELSESGSFTRDNSHIQQFALHLRCGDYYSYSDHLKNGSHDISQECLYTDDRERVIDTKKALLDYGNVKDNVDCLIQMIDFQTALTSLPGKMNPLLKAVKLY